MSEDQGGLPRSNWVFYQNPYRSPAPASQLPRKERRSQCESTRALMLTGATIAVGAALSLAEPPGESAHCIPGCRVLRGEFPVLLPCGMHAARCTAV
jgi:hypothetical protein